MSAILVITGVALLAVPGVVASWAGSLRPDEWRRLNRAAIRLGFAMAALGLAAAGARRNPCRHQSRGPGAQPRSHRRRARFAAVD